MVVAAAFYRHGDGCVAGWLQRDKSQRSDVLLMLPSWPALRCRSAVTISVIYTDDLLVPFTGADL